MIDMPLHPRNHRGCSALSPSRSNSTVCAATAVNAASDVALTCARSGLAAAFLLLTACAPGAIKPAADEGAVKAARPYACTPSNLPASTKFSAEPFNSGLPARGQWRDGFDLADMNGDGHVDLLHGPARKGAAVPAIFLGDGNGQFKLWKEAHFPPMPYDYGDVKAADFNGDGKLDIALSAHLRGIVVMIHEAGGHYAPWGEGIGLRAAGEFPDGGIFSSRSIAIADWNRDGKPDLLALNEGPSRFTTETTAGEAFGLYMNRGGYWQRTTSSQMLHSFGDSIAAGDINGDGHMDAILGTQVAGSRTLLQFGNSDTWFARELTSLPPRAAVTAVGLHDFNRDGRADVINGNRVPIDADYCSELQRMTVDADANENVTLLWRELANDPIVAVTYGDIDNDGFDDLIGLRRQGDLLLFAGHAEGFSRDINIAVPEELQGCQGFDVKLATLADKTHQLIVSYAGEGSRDGGNECSGGGGFKSWHLR